MTKKLSYCLCGDKKAEERWPVFKSEGLSLSGLWLWAKVFNEFGKKGDIRVIKRKHELEDYDIIGLNLTPGNFGLVDPIREELGNSSSTKLVVNIDFEIDNWGTIWMVPTILEHVLGNADLLFHVEPVGANVLEHALQRKVHTLPHPVDLKGLDGIKQIDRDPTIVTLYHRHTPDITTPYFAQRFIPLNRVLLGYIGGKVPASSLYDLALPYMPFNEAMLVMSKAMIGYHVHNGYTCGRGVIENAALMVPCICSDTIEAGRRLFPELTCNPYDVKKQHELMMMLLHNDEMVDGIVRYAWTEAAHYSFENSYKRMVDALEVEESLEKERDGRFWDREYTRKDTLKYKLTTISYKYTNCWDLFVDTIMTKSVVIDLGCGPGNFAKYLHEKGFIGKYIGYEFSEEAIGMASNLKLPDNFTFKLQKVTPEMMDVITKTVKVEENTCIIAIAVLQHMRDDIEILEAIPDEIPMIITLVRNAGVSHLRFFNKASDAEERYGTIFDTYRLCGKFVLAERKQRIKEDGNKKE